jgi:hypothetical protein
VSWVAERLAATPEVLNTLDATLADGDEGYLEAVITEVCGCDRRCTSPCATPRRTSS